MKTRTITSLAVGLLLLGVVIAGGVRSASIHRRILVGALTRQLDHHTPQLAELLASMPGAELVRIEDAAYQELQTKPTTSLLTRSMIQVAPAPDGVLECVIDTSHYHIPPRRIRPSPRPTTAP